jgi:ABC-type amino acid transport substrate-binding protein
VREIEDLRIAVPRARYYQAMARELFPDAEVVLIDSEKEFFEQEGEAIDAMIHVAEAASAWTLLYPQYSVVVPQPGIVKVPIGFALAPGDVELATFLNTWFDLNRKNGTLEALRRYWILGQEEGVREPRWSVIRNVLHWVD